MSSWKSLSVAMTKGFVRDRTALFFTVLFPLMFLIIFGLLLRDAGTSKSDVIQVGSVAVLDSATGDAREGLAQVLDIQHSDDLDAALERVREGDVDAAVEQRGSQVIVHFSAADRVGAATVLAIMRDIVQGANLAASPMPPQFDLTQEQVEDASLQVIQYLTPGLLGWAIATGAMFGSALTLVTWRQLKVLRRLRLSPVSTVSVVGARVGVSMLIAFLQTAIFLAVAMLPTFGLQLTGYWWMALPLVVAGTLAFLAIGLIAGAFAKTPEAASAVANLVVLPMAFLSGAFFPLDSAPAWVTRIADLLPLKHLVDGLLDVMVRGQAPLAVLPDLGILLGFAAVCGGIAVALFRWDDA